MIRKNVIQKAPVLKKVVCTNCFKERITGKEGDKFCHCGRPTKYTPQLLKKANGYLLKLPKGEVVHSIEGLAIYLDITRETVYDWMRDETKSSFSDIVRKILSKQGRSLVNNGLTGIFEAPIAKVMLTKHGYRDAQEIMGRDGKDLIPEKREEIEKALQGMK